MQEAKSTSLPAETSLAAGVAALIAGLIVIWALLPSLSEFVNHDAIYARGLIAIALLAAGVCALRGALLAVPNAASVYIDVPLKALCFALYLLVCVDAVAQLLNWLPASIEARTACCLLDQFDWRGYLVTTAAVAIVISIVSAVQLLRPSPNGRILLVRALAWPLASTVTTVMYGIFFDLNSSEDIGGLVTAMAVLLASVYVVLAATALGRTLTGSAGTNGATTREV
jgi:hypothetical protein